MILVLKSEKPPLREDLTGAIRVGSSRVLLECDSFILNLSKMGGQMASGNGCNIPPEDNLVSDMGVNPIALMRG